MLLHRHRAIFWCAFGVIIIIITLFESQIILAEHECCTNWGDCKSNKSNQIKCWFLRRGENRSSRRKTSRSREENQQTQPTYDAGSGNRTWDTLVEGERSHHYTNPAPPRLNSREWGCFKSHALCQTGFEELFYRDLSLSFKAQCLP